MNLQKLMLLTSILGISILILTTPAINKYQTATIKSIQSSNNKITIQTQNNETELILFDTTSTNLTKNEKIKFQGRRDLYKNKKQVIIDKLYKIKN